MNNKFNDIVFIHIPKNAGTSITKVLKPLGIKCINHRLKENYIKNKKHLIVIRDPLDRFCSAVNYSIKYYQNEQQIKNILEAGLNTPNDWATYFFDTKSSNHHLILNEMLNNSKTNHTIGLTKIKYKWTYEKQYFYIQNPYYIIIYENLNEEFKIFLNQFDIDTMLPKTNVSLENKYLSIDNQKLLLEFYKKDQELYFYYKNKPIEERLLKC